MSSQGSAHGAWAACGLHMQVHIWLLFFKYLNLNVYDKYNKNNNNAINFYGCMVSILVTKTTNDWYFLPGI